MDKFTQAFFHALLWSERDNNDEPLDDNYDIDDIDVITLEALKKDCADFQEQNAELLQGLDDIQCGHDFALTRNHHGAGFWDQGLGEVGDKLTDSCKSFGSVTLYDNGGTVYSE